jgi:GNAT superfamily N-acetyltransferase
LRTRDAGPTERDAALQPVDDLEVTLELVRSSLADYALAESGPAGALASGTYQRAGDVTEIAGVSTLPVARRRGLGAAVTAALARRALDTGTKLVFLSAGTEQSARIYARIGFRRIGTACIAHRPPPTS